MKLAKGHVMVFLFWPLMALFVAWIATNKGRSFLGWFIYGIALWPIALIHVLLISNGSKKCPKCFTKIDDRATTCSACRHKFTPAELEIINSSKKKDQNKKVIIVAIILAVCFSIYRLIEMVPSTKISSSSNSESTATQELDIKTSSYESYDGKTYEFEIIKKTGEIKSMATFTPFLPKDDRNLIEGILRVFIVHYGEGSKINPKPILEARNGANVIRFVGENINYYVSPIKEDTGEVHTIIFWRE